VLVKGGDASLAHDLPCTLRQAIQVPYDGRRSGRGRRGKEREILTEQAQGEGKPPEIVAKMSKDGCASPLCEITLLASHS